MGKRGPAAKGEYGKEIARTAVFSTRIQPDTRARLERAAKENGRSLSQELEHRLRRSFIEDDKLIDLYGSRSNAGIRELLGVVIRDQCTSWLRKTADGWVPDVHKDPEEWLRDPGRFYGLLTAVIHTLMWFKPGTAYHEHVLCYHSAAEDIINEIRNSDPSLPIAEGSRRQHAMAMLKDKLGDLVRRRTPFEDPPFYPN